MSGVGDIIAIAELGFKLAEALKRYVDEVDAAEESIKALVVEVEQASSHVSGLSALLDENRTTAFLSPVGEDNCKLLATNFRTTILTIRTALGASDENETDLAKAVGDFLSSKRQRLQWPLFSRRVLAAPRERLSELKLELQLLMVSATAHKLSKMPSSMDIERQREDAHRKLRRLKCTKANFSSSKRKAKGRLSMRTASPRSSSPEQSSASMSSSSISFLSDDDEEVLILEYLESRRQAEEEERKEYETFLREKKVEERNRIEREKRLIALAEQVEKDAETERRKEEVRREVELENAKERVAEIERQRKKTELENQIRDAIIEAGLEEEKVEDVMNKIEESMTSGVQLDSVMVLDASGTTSQDQMAESMTSEAQTASTSRRSVPRKGLFSRWGSASASVSSDSPAAETQAAQQPTLEAWSLGSPRSRMPLSSPGLLGMVKKQSYKSVLKAFASLPPSAKNEFHALMEAKEAESQSFIWQLVGIKLTKNKIRVGLLTYVKGDVSVVVVLQRQDGHPPVKSARPKDPPNPSNNRAWSSGVTFSNPTSILKKNTETPSANKLSDTVPSTDHHVQISAEAPRTSVGSPNLKDGDNETLSVEYQSQATGKNAPSVTPIPGVKWDGLEPEQLSLSPSEESTFDRERSRSERPISQLRRSRLPSLADDAYSRSDRPSQYKTRPHVQSSSRRSYTSTYPPSRSRSRSRTTRHISPLPSANGRSFPRHDDVYSSGNEDYTPFTYRRRPPFRRSSTADGSVAHERYRYVERDRHHPRETVYEDARSGPGRDRSAPSHDYDDAYNTDGYPTHPVHHEGFHSVPLRSGRNNEMYVIRAEDPFSRRSRWSSPPPPRPRPLQRSDSYSFGSVPMSSFDSYGPSRRPRRESDWEEPVPGWVPVPRRSTRSPDFRDIDIGIRPSSATALVPRDTRLTDGDLDRLRRIAKKHAARRRQSSSKKHRVERATGVGSESEESHYAKSFRRSRRATVADAEEDGNDEELVSDVPERFQDFFNPNYKPPAADVPNGTSETYVE